MAGQIPLAPRVRFGLQGFGDVGKWNDWDPRDVQTHTVGPAIFGKFPLGGQQVFKYNAAVLFKASSAAPDRTLRAQLEYKFREPLHHPRGRTCSEAP